MSVMAVLSGWRALPADATVHALEARLLVESAMQSPFGLSIEAEQHSSVYREILSAAAEAAADPQLDLLYPYDETPGWSGAGVGPTCWGEEKCLAGWTVAEAGQDVGEIVLDRDHQPPA